MKKHNGKYNYLVETAIQRYQQNGFLVGDVVKIKNNALSGEKMKGVSEAVKEKIKQLSDSGANLRISAVKTKRSNTSTGEIGGVTAPADYYVDIVQEINPANWVNPITLPIEAIERVDHENFYPDVPEEFKRKHKGADKGSEDEMGAVPETRTAKDLNLPSKNTKLSNAQKWDDDKPGAGATKELEKLKKESVDDDISNLGNLYSERWGEVVGAVLNNVEAGYGADKSNRTTQRSDTRSGSRSGSSSTKSKTKSKGSGIDFGADLGQMARDVWGAATGPTAKEREQMDYEQQLNRMQRDANLNRAADELGVGRADSGRQQQSSPFPRFKGQPVRGGRASYIDPDMIGR